MMSGFRSLFCGAAAVLLVNFGFAAGDLDQDDERERTKYPFTVKFVDQDGKPVKGAITSVSAYHHLKEVRERFRNRNGMVVDNTDWSYPDFRMTNTRGIANFPENLLDRSHLCVVARQADQKLVAIWKIDRIGLNLQNPSDPLKIKMSPECSVSGRIACPELEKRGTDIGFTNVYLMKDRARAYGCASWEQEFHFFVPPGDYELDLYGQNVYDISKQLSVKPGLRDLDLGAIELSPREFARLIGQPAPELEGISSWKNSAGVKLSELKGKCVILDFWGYWCGPCIHQIPELFQLYDKYHDQGLEILGIHVDQGEDEEQLVDTVKELDARLTQTRQKIWEGRDIPYPVALVTGKRTPYGTSDENRAARSGMSALYGISGYPTMILIDRKGNIVKSIELEEEKDMKLLEKLINDR